MPPVKVNTNTIHVRSDEDKLDFYRTLVAVLLVRAGGTVSFTETEWLDERKQYSIFDSMKDDVLTVEIVVTEGGLH